MDIDVVLVSRNARPAGGGRVIVVSSAEALVGAIRERLGAEGRIGRLRILDSWGGPGGTHPLKSASELSKLNELFSPGGSVQIAAGPVPSDGQSGSPAGGFSGAGNFGGGGFSGGFGGDGRLQLIRSGISLSQLSSVLGVPVKAG